MKSYDIQLALTPTIFRFLIPVSVGGPLVAILTYIHHLGLSKWLINNILWYCKIDADISILDKSVILGLPLCVFAGYSVLTYASDSLTYWLSDRIKTIK